MTEGQRRRQEFARVLSDELAELWREGTERVQRSRIEEIGQRIGMDRDETHQAFEAARGDIWEGEYVEDDGEAGWEAVVLRNVSSTGYPRGTGPL